MGIYVYTARRKPLCTAEDGTTVHVARFAFKPYGGHIDSEGNKEWVRRFCRPAWRSWEQEPLERCHLVHSDEKGRKPRNGSAVYVAKNFSGVCYDADLGEARYPKIGVLLYDGEGPPEIVTAEQEAEAWRKLGAPWTSALQCQRECGGGYRPSLDVSLPEGLLAARVYDAVATEYGDARRAYRYRVPQ